MKQFNILFLFLFVSSSIYSQDFNRVIFDEKAEQDILIGQCNRDGFAIDQFSEWYNHEYDRYDVDLETIGEIDEIKLNEIELKIVMGTWCSDSQREVPRIFRILDELGFDEDLVTLLCVNRDKVMDNGDISDLNIEFVPTIILFKNQTEIGRIIETPNESLEIDLKKIINEMH
jgi:thiol-disulfide isomerase/thioredoxin